MALVLERTARAALTEIDARDAVAAIVATEGVPAPQVVSLTGGVILVSVADRDEVDEWAEMLGASAVRWGDLYGAGWKPTVTFPGLRVRVTVYCAVQPIKWQPRTQAVTA